MSERWEKRAARAIQYQHGIRYTEALRAVREIHEDCRFWTRRSEMQTKPSLVDAVVDWVNAEFEWVED